MMRRRQVLVFLAGASAVWGAGPVAVPGAAAAWAAPAAAVRVAGSWGRAIEVPGLGALNKGGYAEVTTMSCASAGSCAAGGYYRDQHRHFQGFVAVERRGRWGRAFEVPGLGALNTGGEAYVRSVSCASAGSCAAGGYYRVRHRRFQGFVAVERRGRWGRAFEVPGLGALNTGGDAYVRSVSCASAGNCAVGGDYEDQRLKSHGFVASEKNGAWDRAIEVPGLAVLDMGHSADVHEVSCASAGSCAAGGDFWNHGRDQGFVASEQNGVWGRAIEVPGLAALNKGGTADVFSVSCASPGDCAAGGDYADGSGNEQGFVAIEQDGVWGPAIEVPGLAALNSNGYAFVNSVSCASPGNCLAGGIYNYDYSWGFVASEHNGVWGQAIDAPGLDALAGGRYAGVDSVSCAPPGNCAVAGDYEDMTSAGDLNQGYAISGRNGRWGKPINAPDPTLNKGGDAAPLSVSCAAAGGCTVGGYYTDSRGRQQGFVT